MILRLITYVLIFLVSFLVEARAGELLCEVEVNSSMIEGTNKSVFESLQKSISDYLNETEFTNLRLKDNERVECRLFLTIREYSGNRIKGDIQLQLSRPVFNSSYMSPILNLKDTKVDFEYREGDTLYFNENGWTGNLNGILDFYAYLMLGLDADSFSFQGGEPYFEKVESIVQRAQLSGESGWKIYEDDRNRSAIINSFTEKKTSPIRDLLYKYHRKGLDEMAVSPDKGRSAITAALQDLTKIHSVAPGSVCLTIFRDAKLDELVNLYSKAPQPEREEAFTILSGIYPSERERLNKIRNPR